MAWVLRYVKTALRSNEWDLPVRNFGCVVKDDVYRGGLPNEKGYRALRKFGIETVVCLIGDNTELASEHGMRARAAELRWYHLPLSDKHSPSPERVNSWLEWSQSIALMPIFIHCRGGRHRTGGLVAAYRMAIEGWSNERAFKEALDYGFYSEFGHEPWEQFIKTYTPDAAVKRGV